MALAPQASMNPLSLTGRTALLTSLFTLGCATTPQPMVAGSAVPASEGTVNAVAGTGGNTDLTVRVKHLAPANRVASDAQVYVVWVQPLNSPPQNVGVMTVDDALMGELKTSTTHRNFTLLITPEPNGQTQQPSHDAVFTTSVRRAD